MRGNKNKSKSNSSIDNKSIDIQQKIAMKEYEDSKHSKPGFFKKIAEKLDMYDMIIANLIAGNSIIEPTEKLDNSQIDIGFSNISSADQLTKYFMISKFPDFLKPRLIDEIRAKCMQPGVKINFYFNVSPHRINWDSPEMVNRMSIWRRYSNETSANIDVFAYRSQRGNALARNRIITSTKYLNEAEAEYKRSFLNVYFIISISARRDEDSLVGMAESIRKLKEYCGLSEIKLTEFKINMIDWIRAIDPFSLNSTKELNEKLSRKVITDDILANFNSYKQGRVGIEGEPLGIDIMSGGPVMYKFKEDPNAAENWLISAETGGGKSLWVKVLLTFLMAAGFVVCVMDYEGDEYTNLANFIRAANPEDVKIVSMGKGSAVYFDPCEIPDITGDSDVDSDLKQNAIEFIMAIFRVIVHGLDGELTREEDKVLSLAIQRMYDTAGVTDDKYTWHRSKGLRLSDVYTEIKNMMESKELVDSDNDNLKHKAACTIIDSASIYFEPGESKSGTFKHAMSANELYKSKFIIFSFGMKGLGNNVGDPIILALKQLCVAYINIQISNYCKYVRHCFNVKVWEEFQRYGDAKGSADIIANVITGGRKRGDVNFILTNDLAAMLDPNNKLANKLHDNIQNYAIGRIPSESTRKSFVDQFNQQDVKNALDNIAKAGASKKKKLKKKSRVQNRYAYAFCVILNDGTRAVVKARVPDALLNSQLFATGVEVDKQKGN